MKRPTATARLPPTTTTWGLVRESDDHPEQENMTLGAGGTLLRKAVKNNLSKKSSVAENESIYGQRPADSVDSGVSGRGLATFQRNLRLRRMNRSMDSGRQILWTQAFPVEGLQ